MTIYRDRPRGSATMCTAAARGVDSQGLYRCGTPEGCVWCDAAGAEEGEIWALGPSLDLRTRPCRRGMSGQWKSIFNRRPTGRRTVSLPWHHIFLSANLSPVPAKKGKMPDPPYADCLRRIRVAANLTIADIQ